MTPSDKAICDTLLSLALARGAGKSFCPSEAARALGPDWRALMPDIRRVAAQMQSEGVLQATQAGHPVQPNTAKGPIRLRLATGQDAPQT
jgi:hypothetical protein